MSARISLAMSSPIPAIRNRLGSVGRVERVSEDLRALLAQPEAQPGALKSGMTGDQDAPPTPGICGRHHSFQGAQLSRQSCSRRRMSRSVSMGCQKPACLNAIN